MTGATRLAALLQTNPSIAARFTPPPAASEVTKLVSELALPVPPAFFELFRVCDGNARDQEWSKHTITPDDGVALLSLAEVAEQKQLWDGLAREYVTQTDAERREFFHYGLWNSAWIPIANSGVDDVYALATNPCFGGPAGQVIKFNFKGGDDWRVIAESLEDFLGLIMTALEGASTLAAVTTVVRVIGLIPGELSPERFDRTKVSEPTPRVTAQALIHRAAVERGADPQVLRERVVSAATSAAQTIFGPGRVVEAALDPDAPDVSLYAVVEVVERVTSAEREVALADAQALGFGLGDQALIQIFFLEDDAASAESQAQTELGRLLSPYDSLQPAVETWRARYLQIVDEAINELVQAS